MPAHTLNEAHSEDKIFSLVERYQVSSLLDSSQKCLVYYRGAFMLGVSQLQAGVAPEQAFHKLLLLNGADRCYMLDQQGVQLGASCLANSAKMLTDRRFRPLADGSGAVWLCRPYLRRALQNLPHYR